MHGVLFYIFTLKKPDIAVVKNNPYQIEFLPHTPSSHTGASERHSYSINAEPKLFPESINAKSILSNLEHKNHALNNNWQSSGSFDSDSLTTYQGISNDEVRFLKQLWTKIDNSIWESPLLSEYGHTGKVFISLNVLKYGQIDEPSIKIQTESDILKVVAMRAIRKAIKNEDLNIHFLEKNFQINTKFLWGSYEICRHSKGINKNNLSFCKYGENKRKSFTTSEKIETYLGALYHGFGALEEIEKYNKELDHRNTQFDPFVSLKNDPDYNLR